MKRALLAVAWLAVAPLAIAEPSRADLVRWLVLHEDDLRDIGFAEVVQAATGKRLIPVDARRDAAWLEQLGGALDATVAALNQPAHAIHDAKRVNEASRFIEDELRRQINWIAGWKCTIPLTSAGKEQRSGYPDLRIVTADGTVIYLDPKLYQAGSRESSLRTFYYAPRLLTGKIQDDAHHLLVGIAHDGSDAAAMRLRKWELVDVSRLRVSLKAEFQTGNNQIYRSEIIVGRSAK